MAQLPFTTDGINQKLQELYALPDAALLTQAQAITMGIASWLEQNFTLTDRQKAYIAAAPPIVQFNWGTMAGAIVSSRRVMLPETPPKDYGPPKRTKKIRWDWGGYLSYYPLLSGSAKVEGDLQVGITYELVD